MDACCTALLSVKLSHARRSLQCFLKAPEDPDVERSNRGDCGQLEADLRQLMAGVRTVRKLKARLLIVIVLSAVISGRGSSVLLRSSSARSGTGGPRVRALPCSPRAHPHLLPPQGA